ncbi:MAG: hypothetical protein QOJ19_2677 [Acidimicrobiia bacterium]|nr:hypothetical protein [Acidimicrobiia bacterium]
MTETSERYARLSGDFAAKIRDVPPSRWSNPSPCEDWTARDVVRHAVDAHGMFLGFVGRQLGDIPSVDDDPAAAFDAARSVIQSALDNPDRASEEFDGLGGRTTFAAAVDRFICFDLVVHGWDLARATGLDEHLADDDVRRVVETARSFGPGIRSAGVCGPEVETTPHADAQTKMLAFLGRRS